MMRTGHSGLFVTFEGGEGSGKSSVIKKIHSSLIDHNLDVLLLREPGGTEIGENIRGVLFNALTSDIQHEKTEVMLFQASRAQIVHEAIEPHLKNGGVVLLDRHGDSSVAYQGYARGMGASQIANLNKYSTSGLVPDLTLWLDVDPETGIARAKSRMENWNHLDDMEMQFHRDVHYAYSTLHAYDPENRWVRVDANKDFETVVSESKQLIESKLISRGLIEGNIGSPERKG